MASELSKSLAEAAAAVKSASDSLATAAKAIAAAAGAVVDVPPVVTPPVVTPPVVTPPVVVPPVVVPPVVTPSGVSLGCQAWFVSSGWGGSYPLAKGGALPLALDPAYVNDVKGRFTTFRHMDSNATNYSKQVSWSQRRAYNDAKQEAYGAADGNGAAGISYEHQLLLCQATGTDPWLCLPVQVDDDYVTQLARLVSGYGFKRVYLELSNEIDGGWFGQTDYAKKQGVAQNLSGSNEYYKGAAWATKRTIEVGKLARAVLGNALKVVRAGVGNTDLLRQSLSSYSGGIDMLACAVYYGRSADGANYSISAAKKDIDSEFDSEDGVQMFTKLAAAKGISMVGIYEMNLHLTKNADVFARKPEAGEAMAYLLQRLAAAKLAGPCCIYTLHGTPGSGGAWGVLPFPGAPASASPRMVAIDKFLGR